MATYINPYTDFGFKKLFGEEGSKEPLQDFLNELLPEKHRIHTLSFKQSEQLPDFKIERKAIYDIYCEAENGTKFIVEMQKAKLDFFKDRAIFYTTFPIKEQAEKGDWNFELKPVYCIAILDFTFEKDSQKDKLEKVTKNYLSNVQLKDQYCEVFYDKLAYIFVEMPRFIKQETELVTHLDKWLYFLKNLEDFNDIPSILNEPVFVRCFEKARIANFNEKERNQYEESLKVYRDMKGVIETAYSDGEKKGREEGRILAERKKRHAAKKEKLKAAINMQEKGLDTSFISSIIDMDTVHIDKFFAKRKKLFN